jgi:hypothetical protein
LSDLNTASVTEVAFTAEENDDAYVVSQTCDSPSLVDSDSATPNKDVKTDSDTAESAKSESSGFTSLYFLPSAGSYAYVALFMLLIGLMASPFVVSKMIAAKKEITTPPKEESQLPLRGEQRGHHYGSVNAI